MDYGKDVVLQTLEELGIDYNLDSLSGGWVKAKCPLHSDQSPSFAIKIDAGAWMCRSGCGQNSDLADLVSRVTGEPILTARYRLRQRMPFDNMALLKALKVEDPMENKPEPLFYERYQLPKPHLEYMLNRGFTSEILRLWEFGYDREDDSIVVPVWYLNKLEGLIRRRIDGRKPKYLYTSGFNRDLCVFGYDKIVEQGYSTVVLVEGPLDAIWLQMHGIPGIAIMGAQMSIEQANLLGKRFWRFVLCFDSDVAGRRASSQVERLLRKWNIMEVTLPLGKKDVQECTADELRQMFASVSESFILNG